MRKKLSKLLIKYSKKINPKVICRIKNLELLKELLKKDITQVDFH